jgi:two-component system phosphate regulon sensor histidine kinase PhoR
MGVSLAGIILLQLFWIKNAIDIREEQFNKNVNAALRATADKLESHENLSLITNKINKFSVPVLMVNEDSSSIKVQKGVTLNSDNSYGYVFDSDDSINYNVSVWTDDGKSSEVIEYKHSIQLDSLRKKIRKIKTDIEIDSLSEFLTHDIIYTEDLDDTVYTNSERNFIIVEKAKNLNEAFVKLAYEIETAPPPISERLKKAPVFEILSDEMANKGIYSPFEFGVLNVADTVSFPLKSNDFDTLNINKKYLVSLFPNELIKESNFLIIQFPGRNVHILKSIAWALAGSLLLTLIILVTFSITISMILRQKKLSDIKSDFINNMTHEFKTPIATISLAVDSITNPKIIDNKKEVKYYSDIIREENQRMNNQVESVLRMSLLDKHDLEFNMGEYDIHGLIAKAVSKIELLLRERNGKIDLKLEATHTILQIDADHFTNAVLNLLDNAIKYSDEEPLIEIKSNDIPGGIRFSIRDQGMGMSREVSHRIFDKFYRKSSGNIHNIKGFGLGLSYVKAIIDAFGGSISVKSDPGKGSIFEISLPMQ